MTAVQLQWRFFEAARAFIDSRGDEDPGGQTEEVLRRWESVLTRLERDPMECHRELDWVAKLRLLNGFRDREAMDWNNARLQLIDLQYSDMRPDKGLYQRLAARGAVDRLVSDEEIEEAVTTPPQNTRAFFRGECLARYGENVAAASWDSVIFDVPGMPSLQRVPMLEPLRGTRDHVGELLDSCPTARDLVHALTGR
jgi:proteasome accessory factor A